MINIGHYIEVAIEWLAEKGAGFFDVWNVYVEGVIDSFQLVLYAIPFYVFISLTALLAWWKSGKGMGLFTLLDYCSYGAWDSGKKPCKRLLWCSSPHLRRC